jgi:cobalt/nickel transport protein
MGLLRLIVLFFFSSGVTALSHEFWIEPEQYQVQSGAPLTATLRNGENFKGISLAWFDRRFTRFDMISGENVRSVEGRMGDTPALQATAPEDGLLVVVHETTELTVTYRDWNKFLSFVNHKDFSDAVAKHEAMGWPKENFREAYTRHAKALIAVGDGAGSDRAMGLETEFVALTNPYDRAFDGTMRVQVNYQGDPRRNAQVEVFERAPDGAVAVTLHRTDDAGQAAIPVRSGHTYLFDAVVLRPSPRAETAEGAPLWETLWAALTFAVPE